MIFFSFMAKVLCHPVKDSPLDYFILRVFHIMGCLVCDKCCHHASQGCDNWAGPASHPLLIIIFSICNISDLHTLMQQFNSKWAMNSDLSPDSYLQKGSTSVVNGQHKRMQIALLIPLDIMLNDIQKHTCSLKIRIPLAYFDSSWSLESCLSAQFMFEK